MYDIVTVGEILVEILATNINQKFDNPGSLLGPYPSGAPAIMIDQAGKMGAKAAIISKIGDDDFGVLNTTRLKQDGVDIANIKITKTNSTGTAFVTYFDDGSRQFIFHFRHAACGELSADDIDETIITNAKYLHIMGCSITGSPTLGQAIIHAVRIAAANNVKISFDPNIRPELLEGKALEYFKEIIEYSDIIQTGKSELAILFNDSKKPLDELLNTKDRIILVKDGSRGTSLYTRNEAFKIGAFEAEEVDATGAGDCFDATFLSMLCSGSDLKTALKYANAAGALAVQSRGPMEGNSTKEEISNFIERSRANDIIIIY